MVGLSSVIGGAGKVKLHVVGPSQSHPQANGSLRMRRRISQVSILYIIDLLLFYIHNNDTITYIFI